jgi:microcystin-dependent protein
LKTFHKLSILSYFSVGELPAHGHNATANSTGDHTHTVVGRDGGATKYTDNASYYKRTDTSSTYNTGSSGSHTHSVTVDKSGEGKSYNTMQPYLSCYMWRRTV